MLVAFLSATQDIVIDAWRVEILEAHEQGAGAAAVQFGYRIGMLASGAGALYIADVFGFPWRLSRLWRSPWRSASAATLVAREPARPRAADGRPRSAAPAAGALPGSTHVVAPFADFVARPGWAAILLFIVLYKFGDAIAGVMANPFFIDIGFSLTTIASVTKLFGIVATLRARPPAGWWSRLGHARALLICGMLQMLSNLMYRRAGGGRSRSGRADRTIAIENLTGGMGTAAFVAYLSRLCSFAFTATQYALFSSLAAVGRTVLSSLVAGWRISSTGSGSSSPPRPARCRG